MNTDETDVTQLLNTIDATWTELQKSFAGLTDEELLVPGVTGEWSVRDILAHVAVWDAEALNALPRILEERGQPGYDAYDGGVDAFNARMTEENRDLSIEQVLEELDANHTRLLAYLRGVPPEEVAGSEPFRERLSADTYGHYPEHTDAILAWRKRST